MAEVSLYAGYNIWYGLAPIDMPSDSDDWAEGEHSEFVHVGVEQRGWGVLIAHRDLSGGASLLATLTTVATKHLDETRAKFEHWANSTLDEEQAEETCAAAGLYIAAYMDT